MSLDKVIKGDKIALDKDQSEVSSFFQKNESNKSCGSKTKQEIYSILNKDAANLHPIND